MCGGYADVDTNDRRPAETQGAYIWRRILDYGGVTAAGVADIMGVPESSVRRAIQGLRKQGHNILVQDGVYRLVE